MKQTFKEFMKQTEPAWEDLLHHIAEEELISCKVFELIDTQSDGQTVIKVVADCNDKKREIGFQPDLTAKLNLRLEKHKLPDIGFIKVRVYHSDVDPR